MIRVHAWRGQIQAPIHEHQGHAGGRRAGCAGVVHGFAVVAGICGAPCALC